MTPWEVVIALVMGTVEGITEFIPVSSTGHLIITGDLLGFQDERAKTFEIFIQLGAILAILWLYREKFLSVLRTVRERESRDFILNLFIAFLPAAVVGLLTHTWIKAHLFNPMIVAWALMLGGVVILLVEWWKPQVVVEEVKEITPLNALGVGLAQVLALIPGVSRSGATIMGGYLLGLSRTAATEFSFFLAVPVLAAAAGYDLLKNRDALSAGDIPLFAAGFVVAFISALIVVKVFLRYVSHHSFSAFAWYRILFGSLLLWFLNRPA